MYVAVTRAKRRLVLSRAWFFWGNKSSRAPSVFWDEALDTGLVRRARGGGVPAREPASGVGRDGAAGARRRASACATRRRSRASSRSSSACGRCDIAVPRAAPWRCPSTLSVTALLTFIRDEDEFFWRYVRRAPSPPSPAAQLGIELHRRIEEHARGGVPLGARDGRRGAVRPRPRRAPRRRPRRVGRAAVAELPGEPLRADDAADDGAAVHALPRRGPERRRAGSTRSSSARTAPGRSSTTRPARATPTRCSSRSTAARSRRSGTGTQRAPGCSFATGVSALQRQPWISKRSRGLQRRLPLLANTQRVRG